MASSDDSNLRFGRVLLSDALGRLDQFKHSLDQALVQVQDVRFISSLRADIARNEIDQRVAQATGCDDELVDLRIAHSMLSAALESTLADA